MLKLLSSSSSCLQAGAHGLGPKLGLRPGPSEMASPLLRVLSSLTGRNRHNLARRAFFCSDASDGSDQVVEVDAKATGTEGEGEAEAKASSAIVSTNPRPEDYLTVGYSLVFVAHSIQSMKLVIVN